MEVTMWPLVCSPPRQVSRCFHFGKRLPAFLPIRPIIISPPPVPAQRCAATSPMSCHGQGVSHFPALDLIGCRIDIWDHLGCCPTVAAAHNISSTIATRIMEPIISVLYIMRLAWLFAGAASYFHALCLGYTGLVRLPVVTRLPSVRAMSRTIELKVPDTSNTSYFSRSWRDSHAVVGPPQHSVPGQSRNYSVVSS